MDAKKEIVSGNGSPRVDRIYASDPNGGIFIVAWPVKDSETNLQFEYWIGPYEEPFFFSFSGANGVTNLIIFCFLIVTILVLVIIGIYYIYKKKTEWKSITKVERFEEIPEVSMPS